MFGFLTRYTRWLHTGWPSGKTERLPELREDGTTRVPGLYVVGDLRGVPLLKFAADSGARAVQHLLADASFAQERGSEDASQREVLDLVILGAGVSGMSAALEAQKHGLRFAVLEAQEPFATIRDFPAKKPIYTYPRDMEPAGELRFTADIKEELLTELQGAYTELEGQLDVRIGRAERVRRNGSLLEVVVAQGENLLARRVLVAIGRSGNYRELGVPGEELPKVYKRLHDPKDFAGQRVLVVGGGDSAVEAAIALADAGAELTLAHRGTELSRPKPAHLEALRERQRRGGIDVRLQTELRHIEEGEVELRSGGSSSRLSNDVVFTMVGREAPLDFFRKSGVPIRGETRWMGWLLLALFLAICTWIYNWKSGGYLSERFAIDPDFWSLSSDRSTILGTLSAAMLGPAFWYTLGYTLIIGVFGWRRIRRRKTPYVTLQTVTLFLFQALPLFVLPELLLPYLGHNGVFDDGALRSVADSLFPGEGGDREWWRAYGLILAWPLNVYNVFTESPIWGWLIISFVQTFVLIPLLIWRWGKGAYCGWICSCGALAETLGDTQRRKMPHGPGWNRLNLLGQLILLLAFVLLVVRVIGWLWPASWADGLFDQLLYGSPGTGYLLSYKWLVDVTLAGILGVGLYFRMSGRTWCRFACPLAALMNIYTRFSRFRIVAEKDRCISCNECTSICHMGIDVMSFANKGMPMEDPQCVRCSACVQICPTGVLQFGRVDLGSGEVSAVDGLSASPVRMREEL
jgi:NosR/NirI family nitrous oxide reductase transcriptional regulator